MMRREDEAQPGGAGDPADVRLLDVRIVPHRSLTRANFRLLMAIFCLACTASSLPFVVMGAWPVAGFMGLDIAVVYLAFRSNFHAAKAYEDVVLTPLELLLAKVTAEGIRREWRFHPAWVRLEREDHAEYGLLRLALASRGRRVEVAGFLGPDAKADFAARLNDGLNKAKRGPQFS